MIFLTKIFPELVMRFHDVRFGRIAIACLIIVCIALFSIKIPDRFSNLTLDSMVADFELTRPEVVKVGNFEINKLENDASFSKQLFDANVVFRHVNSTKVLDKKYTNLYLFDLAIGASVYKAACFTGDPRNLEDRSCFVSHISK